MKILKTLEFRHLTLKKDLQTYLTREVSSFFYYLFILSYPQHPKMDFSSCSLFISNPSHILLFYHRISKGTLWGSGRRSPGPWRPGGGPCTAGEDPRPPPESGVVQGEAQPSAQRTQKWVGLWCSVSCLCTPWYIFNVYLLRSLVYWVCMLCSLLCEEI